MSAPSEQRHSERRFLDAILVDPEIASCSILASQLHDRADKLLTYNPHTDHESYYMFDDMDWLKCSPQATRLLGTSAIAGYDVRLVQCDETEAPTDKKICAQVRDNALIEIASFAVLGSGPCNYVQFPGEVDSLDDRIVVTPLEAEKRKLLLEDLLKTLNANYHTSAESGEGRKLARHESDFSKAFFEYILCPEEDLAAARDDLRKFHPKCFSVTGAINAAYAAMVGRYADGPIQEIMLGSDPEKQAIFDQALAMLKTNILARPEGAFEMADLNIGLRVRSMIKDYEAPELDLEYLDNFVKMRFEELTGVKSDPLHEEVLTLAINHKNQTIVHRVYDGYQEADTLADVVYRLAITQEDEHGLVCNMILKAQIPTMKESLPTDCGEFHVDKKRMISLVKSDGKHRKLEEAELQELKEILTEGYIEKLPTEEDVTPKEVIVAPKKKRRIFSRR